MNIRFNINPKMLGNHPFAWFITLLSSMKFSKNISLAQMH